MSRNFLRSVFSVIVVVLIPISNAAADSTVCTKYITSLPYTISASGKYCLTNKLGYNQSSGQAITINANNVTLDFNDFCIGNLGAGYPNSATAVWGRDRKNITIRNGCIRGFKQAIKLVDTGFGCPFKNTSNILIEEISIETISNVGIFIEGQAVRIHRCQLVDIASKGMELYVHGGTITDNNIIKVGGSVYNATGIDIWYSKALTLERNFIESIRSTGFGASVAAVKIVGQGINVINNRISHVSAAPSGTADGIAYYQEGCGSGNAYGVYKDNVVVKAPASIGGTNGGNNTRIP